MNFKNILFPVDFSERSRAVVPHVRHFCARFKSSLTLLHVVEMPASSYGSPEAPVMFNFPLSEMKACAEQDLTKLAATEFPGMHVRTAVEEGDAGSGVAAFALRSQNRSHHAANTRLRSFSCGALPPYKTTLALLNTTVQRACSPNRAKCLILMGFIGLFAQLADVSTATF